MQMLRALDRLCEPRHIEAEQESAVVPQGIAVCILIPLTLLGDPAARRHREQPAALEAAEAAAAAAAEETSALTSPLLPLDEVYSKHAAPESPAHDVGRSMRAYARSSGASFGRTSSDRFDS